jgi:hypothetical protein
MSTNLVYTLLCCLSLNFDPCICSVFMIQVSAYIWNHPSTWCIRVCQDHTKSQIIAGAIIVKQLVKKQFTHPNLNIFSIFFFLMGWIFNDFSVSFWGSFQVLHWNKMNCKPETKMLLTMKQCVREFHIIYHPKIFDQVVN